MPTKPSQTKLSVTPVRRYRQPRYPSHQDPDPTQFPAPVPYPAGPRLLAAAASISLATSCSQLSEPPASVTPTSANPTTLAVVSPNSPTDAKPKAAQPTGAAAAKKPFDKETPPVTAKNPLTVALSGLPHRTSGYGTGVPHYLESEIARAAIERVFQEAGYKLRTNHPIELDGVAFTASGYDAKQKVGYIFADWANLDDDAIIHWWIAGKGTTAARIEALSRQATNVPALRQFADEIKTAAAIADPVRREAAQLAIIERASKKLLSLEEAKQLERLANDGKEFIAVISHFDRRFAHQPWSVEAQQEYQRASAIADEGKRKAALRAAQEKAARKSIEKLEQSVREYIAWARSQGAA